MSRGAKSKIIAKKISQTETYCSLATFSIQKTSKLLQLRAIW